MIGIYRITSPTNKVYIGKSINVENRINEYKYISRRKLQHKLNNSINKHGLENHIFEIIEECTLENINEREIYWIDHYNCVENGLNLKYGGEGGKHSFETKNKTSKSMTGKTHSDRTKKKMSEAKKGHPMYTNAWKEKMKKGAWNSGTSSKPIIQCDLEGNIIKEWKSISEAAKHINKTSSAISECCSNKRKTAYGYKWEYKN
jgi:group I intron endonuclease